LPSIWRENLSSEVVVTWFVRQYAVIRIERAVAVLVMLNVFDAILTAIWVCTGLAVEANPVMAAVLAAGVAPFMLVKLMLVMPAAALLHAHRDRPLARFGVLAGTAAYTAVALIHLSELTHLL
jgi:hypothetical protein